MSYLEKEVLGCFLKDNSLVLETIIKPKYFKEQSNQLLFQSMIKLAHEEKAIDRVTLLADNYDYISQLGGPGFITEIESQGKVSHFETYEKKLIEQYKNRHSKELARNFSESDKEIAELMDELEVLNELGIKEEVNVMQLLDEMYELPYQEQQETETRTGLKALDDILGGFKKSNSYIVGARPSIGKSATMLKFALEAMKQNVTPVIFSLEMSKESLIKRFISTIGKINLFIANNPHNLSDRQKETWQKAINTLRKQRFEIYDQAGQTVEFMRAKVRQEMQKNENVLVLIDYLTLIHATEKYQSEHLKIGAISKSLK